MKKSKIKTKKHGTRHLVILTVTSLDEVILKRGGGRPTEIEFQFETFQGVLNHITYQRTIILALFWVYRGQGPKQC